MRFVSYGDVVVCVLLLCCVGFIYVFGLRDSNLGTLTFISDFVLCFVCYLDVRA